MAKRAGLALLVALAATGAAADPDPALRCQRAIERGGLGYARVIGTDPDFAPASIHTIGFPAELTVHPDGRVFFSDTCANFINYLRVLVPF
jgi:hypothetical protein